MKTTLRCAVLAVLAALPLAASAGDLAYDYLDLGFARVTLDGDDFGDIDLDGAYLRGSVGLTESFFLAGQYLDVSGDEFGVDVDAKAYSIVLGGRYPLGDAVDLVGTAGWARSEAEAAGFSADDDGYTIGLGLRGMLGEQVEGEVGARYFDYGDGGDSTAGVVGLRWLFNESFALGIEAEFDEDATIWGVGVRWQFR